METTSNPNPDLSGSYDEAVKVLPMCLQSNDEREQHQLSLFLSQVDQLHKPDGPEAYDAAESILKYIRDILECATEIGEVANSQQGTLTRSEAFARLPKLPVPFPDITGDIAAEIASMVADDVDSHNITISLLNTLQQYSWEVKVALTVTTFVLTFGNHGLNLCPQSKVSLNNSPMIVKQLLEITSCFVEFEPYSSHLMKWKDLKVKEVRTHLVVATYWIIRAVVANATFYIKTISSSGYKFGSAISPPSDEKLEAVSNHLKAKLQLFKEYYSGSISRELQAWKTEDDGKMLRVWYHVPDHLAAEDIFIDHYNDVDGTRQLFLQPSGPYYGRVELPRNALNF